jgi:hypothetical protein
MVDDLDGSKRELTFFSNRALYRQRSLCHTLWEFHEIETVDKKIGMFYGI